MVTGDIVTWALFGLLQAVLLLADTAGLSKDVVVGSVVDDDKTRGSLAAGGRLLGERKLVETLDGLHAPDSAAMVVHGRGVVAVLLAAAAVGPTRAVYGSFHALKLGDARGRQLSSEARLAAIVLLSRPGILFNLDDVFIRASGVVNLGPLRGGGLEGRRNVAGLVEGGVGVEGIDMGRRRETLLRLVSMLER